MVTQQHKPENKDSVMIPGLSKEEMTTPNKCELDVVQYTSKRKPPMPMFVSQTVESPEKLTLASTVSLNCAEAINLEFLRSIHFNPNTQEYHRYNTHLWREAGMALAKKVCSEYMPLINMKPA